MGQYCDDKEDQLDCWTPSRVTAPANRDPTFKASLKTYYGCQTAFYGSCQCMVTGLVFGSCKVTGAHIYKHATKGIPLVYFGLKPKDIGSPRNGFLALGAIETAFDEKQLCFKYNSEGDLFTLTLLDPTLPDSYVDSRVLPGLKWRELANFPLDTKTATPFRRLLCFHCYRAHKWAADQGWLPASFDLDALRHAVSDCDLKEVGVKRVVGTDFGGVREWIDGVRPPVEIQAPAASVQQSAPQASNLQPRRGWHCYLPVTYLCPCGNQGNIILTQDSRPFCLDCWMKYPDGPDIPFGFCNACGLVERLLRRTCVHCGTQLVLCNYCRAVCVDCQKRKK